MLVGAALGEPMSGLYAPAIEHCAVDEGGVFGLSAGLPARWPQIDGIGCNSAFGMRVTSPRL
jgi:hypothetical protein